MNRLQDILSIRTQDSSDIIPVLLAPMAGITDWAYRLICESQGCDAATTEMISAQGFLSARKSRAAYQRLIARAPFEKPLSVQLFGHESLYMAEAARVLSSMQRYSCIDINMGCPARKVTSGGSGSALMRDEVLAGKIIGAVVRASLLPVSVKMRLGWDEEHISAIHLSRIAEEGGAAFVMIHGRTTAQQYSGRADWSRIAEIKSRIGIPLIANGDINSGKAARDALRSTNADGIAVGRASLGNPWIFQEIKDALRGADHEPPAASERLRQAKIHSNYLRAAHPERRALLEMRKFYAWYIKGLRGAAEARTRINTAKSFAEIDMILQAVLEEN